MKLHGTDILSFETREINFGYRLLADLLRVEGVHVLEGTAQSPGKFFGLLNGSRESMEKALGFIENQVPEERMIEYRHVPNIHESILKGLYSLLKVPLEEALLIVELESVSQNLYLTNHLLKETGLRLIDIKSSRGIGGKSISFITGPLLTVNKSIDWLEKGVDTFVSPILFEVIKDPPSEFVSFFRLDG